MKEIEFIINTQKMELLKRILNKDGKYGATFNFVMGYGHQQGHGQIYTRDDNQETNLLPKVSIRTVVPDEVVDNLIEDVTNELSDGSFGDGKIFVRNIENSIQIRTKAHGTDAL
ncbi:P-II family nitrogen regulator [Ligilactobacillus sp. WILCCON 0076]|uniref:P-II family nitrogen regulator n=1 Tax=Ligilactobacillus ubinensis TaxID=2876789 RepID=A0A9X2FRA3_9LACO|nr:P-II family nitrogen regulator [Ligilactobacillus ubinensis]MCP0887828.1 P-II family nitrogen regulator [Ligilactobacillus ubinensis]